ncbi:hypothetical protein [Sinomonas terrae]|uniref:DUF4126 domain-containing protein n=1 Tax=Sinomonas terrae TaxID=2908838 RepID=A0ABS9U572_9MICC|nr:hypothetical protein [Sinomonas terrae]MCH6471832.1 hypothetical protein [Sinomonas terrae]
MVERTLLGTTLGSGLAAGAAGTTALNAATYLDMALRARPASSTPEESARRLAQSAGVSIPGNEEEQQNRLAGLGPLLGIGAGIATGLVLAAARAAGFKPGRVLGTLTAAAAAMAAGNAPMVVLKITDPRTWSATDWASDILPHLAYGIAADAVLRSQR